MRLRLARKLELRMLLAAVRFRGWLRFEDRETRHQYLRLMLASARVRGSTHRRAFRRVWKAETR